METENTITIPIVLLKNEKYFSILEVISANPLQRKHLTKIFENTISPSYLKKILNDLRNLRMINYSNISFFYSITPSGKKVVELIKFQKELEIKNENR